MAEMRVANSHDLRLMAINAGGQTLPEPLDPDGINVLSMLLWGTTMELPSVPLMHRVRVMCKMVDKTNPEVRVMEVLDEDWTKLLTTDQYKAQIEANP